MKSTIVSRVAALALALTVFAGVGIGEAHCGSCGTGHEKADAQPASNTALYSLTQEAGFNTLAAAIKAAGLQKTLETEGPFTVFAPTDEAFAKLPEGTVEALLKDKEALQNILLYHVVSGEVMAADVVELKSAKMLNGGEVTIKAGKSVMINDAKVLKTDVMAKNGVVHVIDTVLIPSAGTESE